MVTLILGNPIGALELFVAVEAARATKLKVRRNKKTEQNSQVWVLNIYQYHVEVGLECSTLYLCTANIWVSVNCRVERATAGRHGVAVHIWVVNPHL